jgi:cullin-4
MRCYRLGFKSLFMWERVSSVDLVYCAYQAYILVYFTCCDENKKNAGMEIAMDAQQDGVMIQRLLDFKEKLDAITHEAFTGSSDAKEAVKKSFQVFINKRNDKLEELVARFIDALLRKKNAITEVEGVLDQFLVLFRYIQGKDVL